MKKLKLERTIFLVCTIICLVAIVITGLDAKAAQAEIEELQYINSRQAAQIKDKQEQIEVLKIILENQEPEPEPEKQYIGEFEITYYTAGPESTGKYPGHPEYGITASGSMVEEGRTIAADENPPLTIEELKKMEGEPVWTIENGVETGVWEIVGDYTEYIVDRDIITMCNLEDGCYDVYADLYGKTWLAYRRKPEEEK